MAYDKDKWKQRFENRSDITSTLTHLTRGNSSQTSVEVLIKILNERKLVASDGSGYIIGPNKAVCFQDAPEYGIAQNIQFEHENKDELGGKTRYSQNGLVFMKRYVYLKGGRPVIYEKLEEGKQLLDKENWWRLVRYDLDNLDKIIDWTHEREWRIKGDFEFTLKNAYVLLGDGKSYHEFIEKAGPELIKSIGGITSIVTTIR